MKLLLLFTPLLAGFFWQPPATATPEAYGAMGDGRTDDGAAIQAALNSGKTTIVFDSSKTYRSSRQLVVPSGVTVLGNGATLKPLSGLPTGGLFPFITTPVSITHNASRLKINVVKNNYAFQYGGAGSLKVGSLILLQGSNYVTYNASPYKRGWYSVITQIAGNTVTLEHAAPASFTATTIEQYTTNRNVHIKNLRLDMTGRVDGTACTLANAINSSIEDLYIEGTQTTGISIGAWLKDCLHSRANNLTVLRGETQQVTGFGIDVQGQEDTVSNCTVNGFHQPIISAHGDYFSQGLQILNNNVSNSLGGAGSAIDFHGNSQGVIDGNVINYFNPLNGTMHGIHIRSDNTTVSNNIITMERGLGTATAIFGFENMTQNINVVNNTIRFYGTGPAYMFQHSSSLLAPTQNLHINYNLVQGGSIMISGPIGDGFEAAYNRLEQNSADYVCINISATQIGNNGSVSNNTIINKAGSEFNYAISTPKVPVTGWSYIADTIYIQEKTNAMPQFRINNTGNNVQDNVIYTSAGNPFVLDFSGTTGVNNIRNNKYLSAGLPNTTAAGAGTARLRPNIDPDALPPATVNGSYLSPWKE